MTGRRRRFAFVRVAFLGCAVALCACVSAASPPAPGDRATTADGTWVRATKTSFPRSDHPAIHDPVRQRMIVFGGFDGFSRNDTWVLSLVGDPEWTQLTVAGSPPSARYSHSAIYDPVRDRMLVFGGVSNDVWTLSLSGTPTWSLLAAAGPAPVGRRMHTAIYDPARDRMVVFGGLTGAQFLGDVWALSLSGSPAWVQLSPSGSAPSARGGHTAFYDPLREQMVVFGGADGDYLHDVWTLSLGEEPAWTQIAATGFPANGRALHQAIYDAVRDRMVVLGGADGSPNNDVWALPLAGAPVWTMLAPGGAAPPPRWSHSAIRDAPNDRVVVFGGHANAFDVWELSLSGAAAWSEITPGGRPPGVLGAHGVVHDPLRDRMWVFGGTGRVSSTPTNEVWFLSLTPSPSWTRVAAVSPEPYARRDHSTIYDPVRDRLIVFGGRDGLATEFGDLWELTLTETPTWTPLAPAGVSPGPRWGHSAVYDPSGDRMIVFGGRDDGTHYGDVWALSLAGAGEWTQLTPEGAYPPVRHGHTAIHDPVRNRMLVFGGNNDGLLSSEVVWALSLSGDPSWSEVAATGAAPSVRRNHSAIYDPPRDRMVVFAGWDGNTRNDVWALALGGVPEWSALSPAAGPPTARESHRAVYDPTRDRMVMFGASNLIEVWTIEFSALVAAPNTGPGSVRLSPAWPNPAGDRVHLRLELPRRAAASVMVCDVSGRRVRVLAAERLMDAGVRTLSWDARDARGRRVPAGVYIALAQVGGERWTRRMVITH